jgi:hypothetical protein
MKDQTMLFSFHVCCYTRTVDANLCRTVYHSYLKNPRFSVLSVSVLRHSKICADVMPADPEKIHQKSMFENVGVEGESYSMRTIHI